MGTRRRAYKVAEVADMAGCSDQTVYNAINSGQLAHVRIGKRTIRIPADAIEAWLRPANVITFVPRQQVEQEPYPDPLGIGEVLP
jgi:excisionase family DNA binding protein